MLILSLAGRWANSRLAATRSTAGMKPWVFVLLPRTGPESSIVSEYLPGAELVPTGDRAARHGTPAGLIPVGAPAPTAPPR